MKENWNFWAKDWSARITIEWDAAKVKLKDFKGDIQCFVGDEFQYERAVSLRPTHKATKTGLILLK